MRVDSFDPSAFYPRGSSKYDPSALPCAEGEAKGKRERGEGGGKRVRGEGGGQRKT